MEAVQLFRVALEMRRQTPGPEHEKILKNMGMVGSAFI